MKPGKSGHELLDAWHRAQPAKRPVCHSLEAVVEFAELRVESKEALDHWRRTCGALKDIRGDNFALFAALREKSSSGSVGAPPSARWLRRCEEELISPSRKEFKGRPRTIRVLF